VRAAFLVCAAVAATPAGAAAQLGELHFGVIGGYGVAESYRGGAGLTFAVVPGRVSFLGLRYVYHWGSTSPSTNANLEFRTSSQTIAADLGVQIPIGSIELVIGTSLGSVRFQQDSLKAGAPPVPVDAWEFLVAPSLTAYFRVGRFLLAPEFQWGLAGDPDLDHHVSHLGPVFYLRLVLPFEIDRIRL
jgi:hypothetical protein